MTDFGTVGIKESNPGYNFGPRELSNNCKEPDYVASQWKQTPERNFDDNNNNNGAKKKTVRFKVPEIEPQYQLYSPQPPKSTSMSPGKTMNVRRSFDVYRGTRTQTGVKPRQIYSLKTRIDDC